MDIAPHVAMMVLPGCAFSLDHSAHCRRIAEDSIKRWPSSASRAAEAGPRLMLLSPAKMIEDPDQPKLERPNGTIGSILEENMPALMTQLIVPAFAARIENLETISSERSSGPTSAQGRVDSRGFYSFAVQYSLCASGCAYRHGCFAVWRLGGAACKNAPKAICTPGSSSKFQLQMFQRFCDPQNCRNKTHLRGTTSHNTVSGHQLPQSGSASSIRGQGLAWPSGHHIWR